MRPGLMMCVLGGGLLVGFAWQFEDPGAPKPGRVLVDDVHSFEWEQSARLMDETYYGDFSSYSMSSLVEHVSRYYAVDVLAGSRVLADVLDDYDVLVLKTPTVDYSEADEDAIRRFVLRGGGLFAIGDHTDLLGMNSRLNRITAEAGITFNFDGVRSASNRYFVHAPARLVTVHPVMEGSDDFEYMTGCSVSVRSPARPIQVARDAITECGDFIQPSYFPSWSNDPSLLSGAVATVAVAEFGEGRILAFTDSTTLSSFEYFKGGYDRFVLRGLEYLNRRRSAWRHLGAASMILGIGLLGLGVSRLLGVAPLSASSTVRAGVMTATAVGLLIGAWCAERCNALALPEPEPLARASVVAFADGDGYCVYPTSLGNLDVPPEAIHDTLFLLAQRTGVECRTFQTREEFDSLGASCVIVVNPVGASSVERLRWLTSWVRMGGVVIVLERTEQLSSSSAGAEFLRSCGVVVERVCADHLHAQAPARSGTPLPGVSVTHFDVGSGYVLHVTSEDLFSRTALGHCFDVPTARQRQLYDLVFKWIREGVSPVVPRPAYYGVLE